MMSIPGNGLTPMLDPYREQSFLHRELEQSEIYEQTTHLIEELTCLRLLWQDLGRFEHLCLEHNPNDYMHLNLLKTFFANFKVTYNSTITRARNHLDHLKSDQHRLGAIALLTQISSAWQSFAILGSSLDELEELARSHETAGDFVTALVMQEHVLSHYSPGTVSAEAAAASQKLLGLYDVFSKLIMSVASRLDLDVDMCFSISPILHRVVRLDNVQLFNAVLRPGAVTFYDYLWRTVAHVAAEYNAVHVLKELPTNFLTKVSGDLFGRSPVLLAVRSDHVIVVRYLLSLQTTCNTRSASMDNLLTVAVRAGLIDMVRLLLVEGNRSNTQKYARNIGLKLAAVKGHVDIVRLLSIAGAEMDDTDISLDDSSHPKTALCYAAEGGHLEVVRYLVQVKADVSTHCGNYGMTPMHGAAVNGHYNIARILLQAGADVNSMALLNGTVITRPASPLELASTQGHARIVRLLASSSSRTSQALNAVARIGHLDAVNVLLELGADTEDLNRTGTTALLEAVSGGHLSVVQRLLQAKANVQTSSRRRLFTGYRYCTPLHVAAGKGLADIVQTLIDAGGNTDVINKQNDDGRDQDEKSKICEGVDEDQSDEDFDEELYEGYTTPCDYGDAITPLLLAAGRGHTQTVQLLLSAGANVDATPKGCIATALQVAASAGHCSTLQVLLEADADVNAPAIEPSGLTALQAASKCGHLDIARQLVSAHADVNAAASSYGATALVSAADTRQLEIVQLLLRANANVNARSSPSQRTPLQIAAKHGDVGIVQLLLQAGAEINAIPAKPSGHTALQGAAERGHLEVVKLLLDAHADVNFVHARCFGSALQVAASQPNVDVVRLLLSANADPNTPANRLSGMTALQWAAKCGHTKNVRLLLNAKADVNGSKRGMTPVQHAARNNHEDNLKQLMTAGADVNALPEDLHEEGTALTIAVREGHYNMAKQLISLGADVNKRVTNNPSALEKALQGAITGAKGELVNLLLNAQVDVNACSGAQGQDSPLGAAASSGDIAMVQNLLTANADVNLGNPLAAAAGYGFADIVRLLLSKQADLNSMKGNDCSDGKPALVSAAQGGHFEVVQILIEAGTNLDIIERALSMAAYRGQLEIVQALLRKGPDPNALHVSYFSALGGAAMKGYIEIMRLLLLVGADPNGPTSVLQSRDNTALEEAVHHGHLSAVRLLLYAGADENPPPSAYYGRRTLLQLAASRGNHEILQLLEDANTSGCRDDSRKRKGKRKAVELDETSSSE